MTPARTFIAASLLVFASVGPAHADKLRPGESHAATKPGHAAALGRPGDPAKASRTVEITMSDAMRFSPSSVSVKRNETVRFVLRNEGKLKHEMVLGTIKELQAHAALMLKFPEMEHADPNQASVLPGKTGELVWQFTKAGTFDFACLQAGHYEAGMKGQVVVGGAATPAKPQASTAAEVSPTAVQPVRSGDAVVAQAVTSDVSDMSDGEIRKVDKDTKKITIKHGEIKNLDMPGMTMLFQVKDTTLLDKVKPGDKVKFRAERAGGAFVVTEIQVER